MNLKRFPVQGIKESVVTVLSFILCCSAVHVCSPFLHDDYTLRCMGSISGIIVICLLCFVCVVMNRNYKTYVNNILVAFLAVGLIEMMLAVAQMLKLLPSGHPFYIFTGSFDNPAVFSMFMSLCIPVGIYLAIKSVSLCKAVYMGITICMGAFLVFSNSRTAIVATLFSIIYIYSIQNKADYKKLVLRRKMLILLIVLCMGLYYYKQDSADGRILIWKVAIGMIVDYPFGLGKNGFDAFYMPYQADYLMRYPDAEYLLLADNIGHPFNEFLMLAIRCGIPGFIIVLCLLVCFLRYLCLHQDGCKTIWVCISITLFIWSLFSYPFQIPFVWLVTAFVVSVWLFDFALRNRFVRKVVLFVFLVGVGGGFCMIVSNAGKYNAMRSLDRAFGREDRLLQYSSLYNEFKDDSDYLYRYGAELHHLRLYKESQKVLMECVHLYNDYNVQMLIAHNYQQLGQIDKAIDTYKYASQMVPNRFLPLYYIMQIYVESKDYIQACETANIIVDKPMKIKKSASAKRIVSEAKEILHKYN